MSESVNIHAAKTQFSKLIERAHNGEEIILAKNGKAYARLVPLENQVVAPRQLGFLNIKLSPASTKALLEPLEDSELELWQ
jgi:prevent-host-death family protein